MSMDDSKVPISTSASHREIPSRLGSKSKEKTHHDDDCLSEESNDEGECPVCRQALMHPIKLPCQHIFCFICAKGAATRSRMCPLCRRSLLPSFFEDPGVLKEWLLDGTIAEPGKWYYQARSGGWWEYDQRASREIETRWERNPEDKFDLLLAGFMYTINLTDKQQYRKDNPNYSRAIKRDDCASDIRGHAGIPHSILNRQTESSAAEREADEVAAALEELNLESSPHDSSLGTSL